MKILLDEAWREPEGRYSGQGFTDYGLRVFVYGGCRFELRTRKAEKGARVASLKFFNPDHEFPWRNVLQDVPTHGEDESMDALTNRLVPVAVELLDGEPPTGRR